MGEAEPPKPHHPPAHPPTHQHALGGPRQRAAAKEVGVCQRQLDRLAQRLLCFLQRPHLPKPGTTVLRGEHLREGRAGGGAGRWSARR